MVGNVRHGNFNRYLGVLYIAAQFAGGFAGAIVGKVFIGHTIKPLDLSIGKSNFLQQVILEVIGSFFLVFMYLSSTDPKTKFTKDAAIQTIILSGSYVGAMLIAGTKLALRASPVNPAVAFGVVMFNGFSPSNFTSLFIFMAAPIGGSFLALLFFRFVYQKTTETMEYEEDDHNSEGLLEDGNEVALGKNLLGK